MEAICFEPAPLRCVPLLRNIVQNYRQLADDLCVLAAGGRPPPEEELLRSPRIDRYRMAFRSNSCLHGDLSGHPLLSPVEREVVTSELIAYALKLKLARTKSR